MSSRLDAATIAAWHLPQIGGKVTEKLQATFSKVQNVQTKHRLEILDQWGGESFFKGATVLEVGCGQGDMSTVLAAAVAGGDRGSVTAWDPAPGTYGSPLTLAEAQAVVTSNSELAHLKFLIDCPLESALSHNRYTHAVLVHSLYYFASEALLLKTFRKLAQHQPPIQYLCLAEYALTAHTMEQVPHLLSVLAQSATFALQPHLNSEAAPSSNVRTVVSPARIKELAEEAGWKLSLRGDGSPIEGVFSPSAELQDGRWEADTVADEQWESELRGETKGAKSAGASSLGAFQASTSNVIKSNSENGQKTATMPVWCAVLERAS